MGKKKILLWLSLIVLLLTLGVPRAESSSQKSVYISKEIKSNIYTQENLRFHIKSEQPFTISLRVGTLEGDSIWINFTTSKGTPSYQPDLIEIPIGKNFCDEKWHEVELLDLEAILSKGGNSYDHLEKIGIRGTAFQLGDIELFSGNTQNPSDLQVIGFDNPDISDMNQYGWYSNDSSAEFRLHYLETGNYLQVEGQQIPVSSTATQPTSTNQPDSSSQSWFPSSAPSNNYSTFTGSSWYSGPVYPAYIPPPRPMSPLFGYGYPPNLPPGGYGPQPLLSMLKIAGLPAYFDTPNPGYPYSAGSYNFADLFSSGSSPYPFTSPFPVQNYGYLTPALTDFSPTYDIYNSSVTSTIAPLATISGLFTTAASFGGGGAGGGFTGGTVI